MLVESMRACVDTFLCQWVAYNSIKVKTYESEKKPKDSFLGKENEHNFPEEYLLWIWFDIKSSEIQCKKELENWTFFKNFDE